MDDETKKLKAELAELKEKHNLLLASEDRFQQLFHKAPVGYQSLDFNGNFIEVNQQWLDILGYKREEVIGHWFGDFLTPPYRDGFRKRFPLFKEQGHIHSEFEMCHKNGQTLFSGFDGKIGYTNTGEFKQTHCILQDITERHLMEMKLEEAEDRYRAITQASMDGFWILNTDGRIMEVNEALCSMLGYEASVLTGMSAKDLRDNETPEEVEHHMKQIMKQGWERFEGKYRKLDGSTINLQVSTVFSKERGYFISFISDISVRKRMEDEIRQSRKQMHDILEGTNAGTWVWNLETGEQAVNPRWAEIIGYSLDELSPVSGTTWKAHTHPEDYKNAGASIKNIFENRPKTTMLNSERNTKMEVGSGSTASERSVPGRRKESL